MTNLQNHLDYITEVNNIVIFFIIRVISLR